MKSLYLIVLGFFLTTSYASLELHIGGKVYDMSKHSDLKRMASAIDDSLYNRWLSGQFYFPELLNLCGCSCDGPSPCCYDDDISLKSSHDIGDSLWLFNPCGNQDSIVTMADNEAYGPAETLIKESTPLWKLIKDFKNLIYKLIKEREK